MSRQEPRRIVVGVDGSPSSVRALAWAVRQGRLTGGLVDVICAWQYPASYGWAMADAEPGIGELSMQTLEKAIAEVGAAAEEKAQIRLHVIKQDPAQALIEAAAGADLPGRSGGGRRVPAASPASTASGEPGGVRAAGDSL
jgi:nucleotide-binding universal stress UspA family protein